ncbi:MAG: hypothetical protein ACRD2A_13665 [Vicinamibacterales bacterium]
MRNLRDLEREINRRLKTISPDYRISGLRRTVEGKYDFELKVSVNPRHFFEIREVLREVLGRLPADRNVQAKYYLSKSLAEEIRKKAVAEGVTQSQFVSRCVAEHLRKDSAATAR